MNEQTNQPENQSKNQPGNLNQNAPVPAKKSRRKWWIGGGVAVVALGALAASGASFADGGFSRAHWRGHHHGMNHSFDPARMGKKVEFGVDLILGRVGADEKQKTKVTSTIKGVLGQVPAFRQGHIDARDQLIKLLKADKFDKAALEKLRAERIKAIDEASKKVAAALGEVADTLSDKQRKELVEFAERRRRMFGRH